MLPKSINISIFLVAFLSNALLSTAQRIGIGINNPTRARLELHGAVGATSAIFGGESTGISVQRNWPSIGFNQYYDGVSKYIGNGYAAVQYFDPNYGALAIDMFGPGLANANCPAPIRALTLTNSGNLSIGPTIHNSSLSVSRIAGSTATAHFLGTTHHTVFNYGNEENTYIRAGKDNGVVYINGVSGGKIIMSGLVGINTATPGYPLEIRQRNQLGMLIKELDGYRDWGFAVNNDAGSFLLRYNGIIKGSFSPSSGSYSATSDRRIKTNIQPLVSVLDKILQLEPVEYEMKYDNPMHEKTLGLIAQDVAKIFPDLVNIDTAASSGYDSLKNLHSLNYNAFNVLAIKAVQEQQLSIQNHDRSIEIINAKLEALEEKLKAKNKK